MIFSPDLATKVLDGSKTQTRRRWKWGEDACRYVVGRTYAVQDKRGGTTLGRIHILSAQKTVVANISRGDARAEGFSSTRAFYDRWREMYGHASGWCWRIEFALTPVAGPEQPATEKEER